MLWWVKIRFWKENRRPSEEENFSFYSHQISVLPMHSGAPDRYLITQFNKFNSLLGTPVTRNFILTLSIGVTFGFVFAFMFLSGSKYSTVEFSLKGWEGYFMFHLIYPLDSWNTRKPKTKTADFFVNTRISVKFFQKSQNKNITFYEKFKK